MSIVTERSGGVLRVRLNRPERKNAITLQMYRDLHAALVRTDADDAIGAMLLEGADDFFTAGNDIGDFVSSGASDPHAPIRAFLDGLEALAKPLVAAVNGFAIGVGTTVLLHCDHVHAGAGAIFSTPFTKLGLCPEAGSSYLLPQLVGPRIATAMLLGGAMLDAQRALACGLVTAVSPPAEVTQHALATATALAALPREAVIASKRLIRAPHRAAVRAQMAAEYETFAQLLRSPAAQQAFAAFLSKA